MNTTRDGIKMRLNLLFNMLHAQHSGSTVHNVANWLSICQLIRDQIDSLEDDTLLSRFEEIIGRIENELTDLFRNQFNGE